MPRRYNLTVHGGSADALSPLVSIGLADLAGHPAPSSTLPATARSYALIDDQSGARLALQLSADGALAQWIVPGRLAAGGPRHFTLSVDDQNLAEHPQGLGGVTIVHKLDRLLFLVNGAPRAQYTFLGARRPYFWPVLGPAGISVVRGQGTEEHPHHTGLTLAYGGHGEGGSTNIWSDWDEPPYGPCGRIVHRGFRLLQGGPVFAEAVEDLTYLRADGEPLLDEVRRMRVWSGPSGSLFLDFTFSIAALHDAGTHPFLLAARLPGSMDIPATGRVVGSDGARPSSGDFKGRWVDGSGPLGDGWNGIALLDHPRNHGYPGDLCKYAVAAQISQCHYPPAAGDGQSFSFQQRVYVHDGAAQAADVEQHWAAYALELGVTEQS